VGRHQAGAGYGPIEYAVTLLQIGVALFLFTSFEGFAVPYFAVPNLGRSVHTLSAFSGVLLHLLGPSHPTSPGG
jgi:hypothetical protein